jgi:ribosomal-protein-alanine N-acetyltransferase
MPALVPPVVAAGRMRDVPQPTLRAGGLQLRPWGPGDAPGFAGAFCDGEIRRWHVNVVEDEDEALEWIEGWQAGWVQERGASWAVVDVGAAALFGLVALRDIDMTAGQAECSYWVLPEARGRGVATEALARMAGWAFDDLGLHRLTLVHCVENLRSCRVAAKAGFALEGTGRSAQLLADGWHDVHLHARLSGDHR